MKKYVIDASIVLKSLLSKDSNVAKKFEKLLTEVKEGQAEVISHSLINLEVANGLRFTLKDKELALEIFKTFQQLPHRVPNLTKAQHEKILDLSYHHGTTVYDTSYHILAKSHGATFLTSDKEYFKKANKLGSIEFWE